MWIDKFETYILNIVGLQSRSTKRQLMKICRNVQFCESFQYNIIKYNNTPALEISLPKQQLPYFISFLSFYQISIYQILSSRNTHILLDSGQHYSSSKRFNLCIDGLQDAFIKDKVIDIMTYFSNQYDLTYTLNNNYASVCCKPEIFSKLIQFIACRNIDILSATYKARTLHNARIS